MSQNVETNKNYPYKINFIVDGDFVSPSAASITLKDNSGDVVESIENTALTIPTGATSVTYLIPAAANVKTLPYEIRYVSIQFTYQGKQYGQSDFYVLRDNMRLPITYDDVRAIAGLGVDALPDENIDLFMAYGQVQADVPDTNLDNLLATGSALIPYLQQAVALKAAMNSTGVLELMVFQSEQADNTLYKRFAKMDFNDISLRLAQLYMLALAQLNGDTVGTLTSGVIFSVVTGTDPITGA